MNTRVFAVIVILAGFGLMGALAGEMPRPGNGPEFGQHVSSMAPEHAREHGAHFGGSVSDMARGKDCGHH